MRRAFHLDGLEYKARRTGEFPFALQRALELEAAFQVFFHSMTYTAPLEVRERLASRKIRDLHAGAAAVMKANPRRRYV